MKQQADKGRSDRHFEVDDWVYVKLQPYRQSTVVNRKCLKLSAKFFVPYRVVEKIGPVAYKLAFPDTSRIHPVFHVSQLKKHVGALHHQSSLPVLTEEGVIAKEPISIVDRHLVNKQGKPVTEILVAWKNSFPEDSTWENYALLMQKYPDFHP